MIVPKYNFYKEENKKMLEEFNLRQFLSAFVVLFAVIDAPGSIPVILKLKRGGKQIHAERAAILSLIMFLGFFYVGEAFLNLFKLDISSFAVAGSLIIFIMALEMILDIDIFHERPDMPKDATFIPIVFPLFAGAGALTTLLSIRAQFSDINIITAIIANIIVIYCVVKMAKKLNGILGNGVIYMMQKFFGIILLAISVKLFTANITILLENLK